MRSHTAARLTAAEAAPVSPPYVRPVVLTGVPEGSLAVTEETFGPTVTVTPVADLTAAVELANAGRYGLGSAVFSGDRTAAMRAARSLRTGMTSINSALGFVTVQALPFGGVGESGFGRVHGADGLREFCWAKAITRQRSRPLINLTTFGRTEKDMTRLVTLVTLLHGRLYQPRGGPRPAAARTEGLSRFRSGPLRSAPVRSAATAGRRG